MIKAIETVYNGYRFRSRLEARWAVFFDELGVKWTYEQEGYDLGAAGWYLPDFALEVEDSLRCFVEVKPEKTTARQRLYLAGKFTGGIIHKDENDWRENLISLKGENTDWSLSIFRRHSASRCGLTYVGPYPVDLTSGHGGDYGHFEENGWIDPTRADRCEVLHDCLDSIKLCNVFFAWIDSLDCYGTLAEIGYAYALGKRIYIGYPSQLNVRELWFSFGMAEKWIEADTPEEAFYNFFPLDEEEVKAKALASQAERWTFIVYGDPMHKNYSMFGSSFFLRHCENLGVICRCDAQAIERAALAARSARFEHGERR